MHTSRRVQVLVAVMLAVLASLPLTAPERVQAQPQTTAGALVLRALQILGETYVDPVDPITLLNAALAGVRRAGGAAVSGETVPDVPAGLSAPEGRQVFLERFAQAARELSGTTTESQLAHAAIQAMTAQLQDSHTGFLSGAQYRERLRQQRGEPGFSGIGIVILVRGGNVYVREVVSNSPAENAGLRALDRIIRVDQRPVQGSSAGEVAQLIRGPSGSEVVITVQRAGSPEPLAFTVMRAPIVIPPVRVQMLAPDLAYVRIVQFDLGTGDRVRAAVSSVLERGAHMVILDLRGNPGGFLYEVNQVAEIFLRRGVPVYGLRQRGQGVTVVRTQSDPLLPETVALAVLVDENSASAAELLASAIQEQGRGAVIGARTAGALEASILVPLPDGSALSVTIARMYTGKGARLEGVGLTPDQDVQMSPRDLERGQDSQLEAAIRRVSDRHGRRLSPDGFATRAMAPVPVR